MPFSDEVVPLWTLLNLYLRACNATRITRKLSHTVTAIDLIDTDGHSMLIALSLSVRPYHLNHGSEHPRRLAVGLGVSMEPGVISNTVGVSYPLSFNLLSPGKDLQDVIGQSV